MKKHTRVLRKALLLAVCGLTLVSVTVGATLAYLTDTHSVVNTFTVGNVGLTMTESKVDVNGNPTGGTASSNTYKLIPGSTYTKNPTITINADSEDGWLFVRVENGIADIEDSSSTIDAQMTEKGWALVSGTENVYAYENAVQAAEKIKVFDSFTIAGAVNNTTLAAYENAQIVVTAYLVQAAGFDTAADAWSATADQFAAPDAADGQNQ